MKFASLPVSTAARILSAFGFGFFLSMFTRAVANIIKQPVQADLGLSEEMLSLALGTSFFVAFGLMQLPLGVLLDRYDPRRVNAFLFTIAGTGAAIFAGAEDAATLAVGRALMGLGFAGGMMASLKTYSMWFPVDRLPSLNGLQFAIGVLGAISATKPTAWLLQIYDWREITLMFAVLTFAAAAILAFLPPKHAANGDGKTLLQQLRELGHIYGSAYFWRVTPFAFISLGISQGVGTLYVFSWLTDVAEYTPGEAASLLTLTASVAILNFLALGPLAERLERKGHGPMLVPTIGLSLSMVAMAMLILQWTGGVIMIWLLWTMSIATGVLTMPALAKAFPSFLSGRAFTAFNMMGFVMTAISQWTVGYVLDLYPRTSVGASPDGYSAAFGILLGLQALGLIWYAVASALGLGTRTMVEANADG